jgi:hypothetical protein
MQDAVTHMLRKLGSIQHYRILRWPMVIANNLTRAQIPKLQLLVHPVRAREHVPAKDVTKIQMGKECRM